MAMEEKQTENVQAENNQMGASQEILEKIRDQEQIRRFCVFPIAIAFIVIVVAILSVTTKKHCFVDMPLFVIFSLVSLILIVMMINRGRELSNRINRMIEEEGGLKCRW